MEQIAHLTQTSERLTEIDFKDSRIDDSDRYLKDTKSTNGINDDD